MRRLVIIGLTAVVVIVALLVSYATPLGATTLREISVHLDGGKFSSAAPKAADTAPTPGPTATPEPMVGRKAAAQEHTPAEEDKTPKVGESANEDERAYLGVVVVDAENGARVAQVFISGPAQKAGVKKEDIIRKVNGAAVTSAEDVVSELRKVKPGDRVTLVVSRDGSELTVYVVAGSAPRMTLPEILGRPNIPELEGLGNLPLHQFFGRFLGGEMTFEGQDGQIRTIKVVPGKVKAVTSTSISIEPNDSRAEKEYAITDKTIVYAGLAKRKAENLKEGDKVVIIVVGDSNRASVIVKTQPASWPFQRLIPNAPAPKNWWAPES